MADQITIEGFRILRENSKEEWLSEAGYVNYLLYTTVWKPTDPIFNLYLKGHHHFAPVILRSIIFFPEALTLFAQYLPQDTSDHRSGERFRIFCKHLLNMNDTDAKWLWKHGRIPLYHHIDACSGVPYLNDSTAEHGGNTLVNRTRGQIAESIMYKPNPIVLGKWILVPKFYRDLRDNVTTYLDSAIEYGDRSFCSFHRQKFSPESKECTACKP